MKTTTIRSPHSSSAGIREVKTVHKDWSNRNNNKNMFYLKNGLAFLITEVYIEVRSYRVRVVLH